jgi:hypothetical protein
MKLPGFFQGQSFAFGRRLSSGCFFVLLAGLTLLVTGCPHNEYQVLLKPQGDHLERTLVFYCADGINTNTGIPHYQPFDPAELAGITACYTNGSVTNEELLLYTAHADFRSEMPGDVGGRGTYTNLTTSLGSAGFYAERFRGNDDLAGTMAKSFHAADQLTDLFLGWSRMELRHEPGYDKLRTFLDKDFRQDLKNLTMYWWQGQFVEGYRTNASEEFIVRFGQYLWERGYFKTGEMPAMFRAVADPDGSTKMRWLQRLVATKMGVPETSPIPKALVFLADSHSMEQSFNRYLTTTKAYQAKMKQWRSDKKHQPDLKAPEPGDVVSDVVQNLVEFDLLGTPDHLKVQLALPVPPTRSNGRWDADRGQVVWESSLEVKTNRVHMPVSCYAAWSQPNDAVQKEHFGRALLTGDNLILYCLWRDGLDSAQGQEWEAFLAGLKPGKQLADTIEAFQFAGEAKSTNASTLSSLPRELLGDALK